MKIILLCLTATIISTLFLCTLPSDPSKDPNNASVSFSTINGQAPTSPVEVIAGDSVSVDLRLNLPNFINNISYSIGVPGQSIDTQGVFVGPWLHSIASIKLSFPHAGTRWCIVTSHNSNGSANSDTLIFNVIAPVINQPPVWNQSAIKKNSLQGMVDSIDLGSYCTDPDNDSLFFTIDTFPAGTPFQLHGCWLVVSGRADTGTYAPKVKVSDGAVTAFATVNWRVVAEVSIVSPVITTRTDSVTINENGSAVIAVLANDTISDGTLCVSSATRGKYGATKLRGDTVEYIADSGKSGTDTLSYFVNNGLDSGRIIITIVKLRFFVSNDSVSVSAGGSRNFDVLVNDSVSAGMMILSRVAGGTKGKTAVTGGKVAYTADSGKTGFDTLKYYVNGGRDSGMVFVNVLAITTLARADNVAINEDTGIVTIDVLDNDSISAGVLVLTSVLNGRLGVAEIVGNKISYSPMRDSNGVDTLCYFVNNAVEGIVRVNIRAVNDPPIARDTGITIAEDSARSIRLAGFDVEGTLPRFIITEVPAHGNISSDSSAQHVYRPASDFFGTDSFFYKTFDGELFSVTAKVKITVLPRNDVPQITINSGLAVNEGGASTITSSRFACTDPDNAASELTVVIAALPVNGKFEKSGVPVMLNEVFPLNDFASGVFVYTHNGSETTADSIKVTISDSSAFVTATINAIVTPVNDPPVFSKTSSQMKNSAGMGNFYRDTVVITDSENGFGNMTVSAVPAAMKTAISAGNGRLTIDWIVDNRVYVVGQVVPVSVTIQDGANSVKLEWAVTIGKHVWTKVAGDVQSYGVFAAVDSFVMFNAWIQTPDVLIYKNDLKNSGGWVNFAKTGRSAPGSLEYLLVKNSRLYCNSGLVTSFNLSTGTAIDSINGIQSYFYGSFVADDGTVFGIESGSNCIFSRNGVSGNLASTGNNYYRIGFYNDLTFSISREYDENGVDVGCFLNRWNADCWNYPIRCQNSKTPVNSNMITPLLVSDGNNGDTLYVAGNGWVSRVPNSQAVSIILQDLPIAGQEKPTMITMVDGKIGFLVDEDGNLFFTNNGFGTLIAEEIEPLVTADYVYVSSDKKAVFALSRQDLNHCRNFYRY